jgi:molybdate transport system substrate-binding protein
MARRTTALIAAALMVAMALLVGCKARAPEETTPVAPVAKAGGGGPEKEELSLYVPCGLTLPLKAAIMEFEAKNPTIDVADHFDSGVVLVRDILDKGKRPDLFISPGPTELGDLEEAGLIDESTKKPFGSFELVVLVPSGNPAGIHSLEDLTKAKTIACPDPEHNSVGESAKQALEKLGLWEKIQGSLMTTEIAHESHQYVSAGKVDAGLAYKSCPLDSAPEKLDASRVAIAADFPKDSYETPKCYIAMLSDSTHKDAAAKFVEYLMSDEGQSLLRENHLPGMEGAADAAATTPDSGEAGAAPTGDAAPTEPAGSDAPAGDAKAAGKTPGGPQKAEPSGAAPKADAGGV